MAITNGDRTGTVAISVVNLMEKLLGWADWIAEKGEEQSALDPTLVASGMKATYDYLGELAKLLTEAVPGERERLLKLPYQSEYGTQLSFSDRNYQPGNRTVANTITFIAPGQSVINILDAQEESRPKLWLHSARGAVLTYAADFWHECVWMWYQSGRSKGNVGWPLDLPTGQRLSIPHDFFGSNRAWLSWGWIAAQYPKLVNGLAVRQWIANEGPDSGRGPSVKKLEAEAILRELDKQNPAFKSSSAEKMAEAVVGKAKKKCSPSLIKNTDYFAEAMRLTGRTRTGARGNPLRNKQSKSGKTVAFTENTPVRKDDSAFEEVDERLDASEDVQAGLIAQEKQAAIDAVQQSGMAAEEKQATLEKLGRGAMSPQDAKELATCFPAVSSPKAGRNS